MDFKKMEYELSAEGAESSRKADAYLDLLCCRNAKFEFHLPRYSELTPFPIYMSQLLNIVDSALEPFSVPGEEKIITKAMINNYVQKKVIMPPQDKKYDRTHIIHLIVIGILKQIITIEEITQLIQMQLAKYPKISIAYNFFCIALEDALNASFNGISPQDRNRKHRPPTVLSEIIESCVMAFSNRVYVRKALYMAKAAEAAKSINGIRK